jgi:hypothetical protein
MAVQLPPQADIQRRLRKRPGRLAGLVARPLFGLLMVLDGVAGALAGHAVWHARPAVGSAWTAAVAAGLAFPVVLMGAARLARRRVVRRVLGWAVVIAVGNGVGLIGLPLTHAWQAGVAAIVVPVAAVVAGYTGWLAVAPRSAGFELCLGIVARDGDGWNAVLVRNGRVTETLSAVTLTEAADAVKARVRELRPRRLAMTGLHLIVVPWADAGLDYDKWYRVSGSPGRLTAAVRGRPRVNGATVEELVAAVESAPGTDLPRTALWWPGGPPLRRTSA